MKKIDVNAIFDKNLEPVYSSKLASGADLFANIAEDIFLKPLERALIPTGLFLDIPVGYEAQVRPRSGLAIKKGLTCLNTPGTIDADYRGEVKVILVNLSNENICIQKFDRVAQIVFAPVVQANFVYRENLSDTDRGAGGFGSTGV